MKKNIVILAFCTSILSAQPVLGMHHENPETNRIIQKLLDEHQKHSEHIDFLENLLYPPNQLAIPEEDECIKLQAEIENLQHVIKGIESKLAEYR